MLLYTCAKSSMLPLDPLKCVAIPEENVPSVRAFPRLLLCCTVQWLVLHAGGTVNADDLAINPLAVLGCEEADDAGDVDWLTDAVHRGPCGRILCLRQPLSVFRTIRSLAA